MPKDFILDHFLSAADSALAKKFKDESDMKRLLYSLSDHAALYASKVKMCQHKKATASTPKEDDLAEATPVTACTSTSSSPRVDDVTINLSNLSSKRGSKHDLDIENGEISNSSLQAARGALKAQFRESYRDQVLAWFTSLSVRERVRALMIDDQRFLQTLLAMKKEEEGTLFFIRDAS